ncbi:MAG: hypothetical protein WDO14_16830 [Bacteroidota bacterium]
METRTRHDRPNVDLRWFWDFEVTNIDWRKSYITIIERIPERGSRPEWQELTKYYGNDKVVNALKHEITFLPEYILQDVCSYFHLNKEELLCCTRKQSRPGHWI